MSRTPYQPAPSLDDALPAPLPSSLPGRRDATPRAVVVEETEFLTSLGVAFCQVAQQLRMTPPALARALYRAGRADLGNLFRADVWGYA